MNGPQVGRHPPWLKVRAPGGPGYSETLATVSSFGLHTVCQEAHCPNIAECWGHKTATFMLLGQTCTRNCAFCAVTHGRPLAVDAEEPARVAEAVGRLGLRHVVVTSVNTVVRSPVDIFNHNLETVPRLYRRARAGARYERSLAVLGMAKVLRPGLLTKAGLMLGLGESVAELMSVFSDLRLAGCDILTLGQYLRPSADHLPVERYVPPEEFAALGEKALGLGFRHVEAGPLLRSSYHAWSHVPPS